MYWERYVAVEIVRADNTIRYGTISFYSYIRSYWLVCRKSSKQWQW